MKRLEAKASPATNSDRWRGGEQHLSARLLQPLLKFYEIKFGGGALAELAAELGTNLSTLRDLDLWFSTDQFIQINEAMIEATGEEDITYQAGRALSWPGMMGAERTLLRALASPRFAFEAVARVSTRYSKVTSWSIEATGRSTGCAVLDIDPSQDHPSFCSNRIGFFEAIPEVFDLPPARVAHPECLHRGDSRCVYDITWIERKPWARLAWMATGMLALATVGVGFGAIDALLPLMAATGAAGVLAAGLTVRALQRLQADTEEYTRAHVSELEELLERNKRRLEELHAIERVTSATRLLLDEDELAEAVVRTLREELEYDRVLLMRVDSDRQVLRHSHSDGFEQHASAVEGLEVSLEPEGLDTRLFGRIVHAGEPVLIDAVTEYASQLLPENRALVEHLGTRAFVAAPVEGRGQKLGLLVVDRLGEGSALGPRDRQVLGSVSSVLGAAISNARLFRRIQDELLINRKFRQYLPDKVVDEVRSNPEEALELGGNMAEMAVMFVDIAGFTAMSSELDPSEVVRGLNAWFGITDPVIERCNGIVDKRMGDGILVVFLHEEGAREGRHPVQRAAAAAVGLHLKLEEDRERLASEAPAFASMLVRSAIHYGSAIVGNMGSDRRMEYTVIGDTVNTAARVEEQTPAGAAWLSGEAVRAVGEGLEGATLVQKVVLRGRSEATELWALDLESESTASGTWNVADDAVSQTFLLSQGVEAVEPMGVISEEFDPPF